MICHLKQSRDLYCRSVSQLLFDYWVEFEQNRFPGFPSTNHHLQRISANDLGQQRSNGNDTGIDWCSSLFPIKANPMVSMVFRGRNENTHESSAMLPDIAQESRGFGQGRASFQYGCPAFLVPLPFSLTF